MTLEKINPQTIVSPFNDAYHHTVIIPAGSRIAHTSGQVGLRKDGTISDDAEEQIEQTWKNVIACIEAADMATENIVKITAYLVNVEDYPIFAEMRSKYIGDARPAATSVLVKALVKPEWRIEIEAVAAK